MFKLLYLSTATDLFSDEDLYGILNASRDNNERHDITGMLLYHEGCIMQALEGSESQVMSTFHHICKDPRHQDVVTILTSSSEDRTFAGWTMGFRRLSSKEWSSIAGYVQPDSLPLSLSRAQAFDLDLFTFIKSFHNNNFRQRQYL